MNEGQWLLDRRVEPGDDVRRSGWIPAYAGMTKVGDAVQLARSTSAAMVAVRRSRSSGRD
jgi:hypothetical protein